MHHLNPGDIVACRGLPWVVWSVQASTVSVLAVVSQASGPQYRADVCIGECLLSPLPGPLLVTPYRNARLSDFDQPVKIGSLPLCKLVEIKRAMEREAEALALERGAPMRTQKLGLRVDVGRRVGARGMV